MIKVNVMTAGWSPENGTYLTVLQENGSDRYCAIVLDEYTAQAIAILLEWQSTHPHRPLRLLPSLLDLIDAKILRIELFKQFFGETVARIVCRKGKKIKSFIYATGEAIELALRCNADILVEEPLLEQSVLTQEASQKPGDELKRLKEGLQKAVALEAYEEAAKLRDKIAKLEQQGRG